MKKGLYNVISWATNRTIWRSVLWASLLRIELSAGCITFLRNRFKDISINRRALALSRDWKKNPHRITFKRACCMIELFESSIKTDFYSCRRNQNEKTFIIFGHPQMLCNRVGNHPPCYGTHSWKSNIFSNAVMVFLYFPEFDQPDRRTAFFDD